MKSCPKCGSYNGLREILYGLPEGPVDEEVYSIGGCCITDKDPTLRCVECSWEGEYRNNLPHHQKQVDVVGPYPLNNMTEANIDGDATNLKNNSNDSR